MQAHPDEVHLLVAVVNYKTKLVKSRRGLCSTWLASLDSSKTDLRIPVWVKKGTISFPKALDVPTLMIGPGILHSQSRAGNVRLFRSDYITNHTLFPVVNVSLHFCCYDSDQEPMSVFTFFDLFLDRISRERDSRRCPITNQKTLT